MSLMLLTSCDFTSKIHKQILEAQNLLKNAKYKESIGVYEKILNRIPPSLLKSKIHFQLGEIYNLYLNNDEKSSFYFEKILQETSDPRWIVQVKEKLAKIYFENKKIHKARKYYEQLYGFFPKLEKQDFYHFSMAKCFLKEGLLKRAEQEFYKILKAKDHEFQTRSYFYLGLVNFNSKKWKEAASYWLEYLKKETKKSEIVETKMLLANAYETMEDLKSAYGLYYSLLGEYPNSMVIKNRLESVSKRRIERKR